MGARHGAGGRAVITELEEISTAAVDAVNYRVARLGEPLEDAVREVEALLRARGIIVNLHLSTATPTREPEGDNVAIYEVAA